MNEDELRDALRSAMTVTAPPPPMSASAVVSRAHRTRVRQRTIWASAGGGLVAATVLVAGGLIPGGPAQPVNAGGPAVAPNPAASKPQPWPTGSDGQPQEDRTARAGQRYEQGAKLLDQLIAAVPQGYTVPDRSGDGGDVLPSRNHQAVFENRIDGTDVWSYLATVEVAKGGRTGLLMVEVYTAGNQLPTEPCALTLSLWGLTGDCQLTTVGTDHLGVVVTSTGGDRRLDQWAGYRHPDGVVVFVAQAVRPITAGERQPGLTRLPFTVDQLATLATSENLHQT